MWPGGHIGPVAGTVAVLWSPRIGSNDSMRVFGFYFDISDVVAQDDNHRYDGFPLRCLVR